MKLPAGILALLAVMFLVGCINRPVKTLATDGLLIESFSADPLEVKEFREVGFFLFLENVGDTTASNIRAELSSVQGIWRPSGNCATERRTVGDRQQRPASGSLSLTPPRPSDGQAGGSTSFDWELCPPDFEEGVVVPLKVTTRINYDYSTSGTTQVKAISFKQMDILRKRGEAVSDPLVQTSSNAPVKLELIKGPTPVIIDPSEPGAILENYRFQIRNVGSGWPVTDGVTGKVKGNVKVFGPGVSVRDCTSGIRKDGNTANFDDLKLRTDGTVPFSCTIEIAKQDWQTRPEDSILFTSRLEYSYSVEKDVTISVQGLGAGLTPSPAPTPSGCSSDRDCTYSDWCTQDCRDANNPSCKQGTHMHPCANGQCDQNRYAGPLPGGGCDGSCTRNEDCTYSDWCTQDCRDANNPSCKQGTHMHLCVSGRCDENQYAGPVRGRGCA